MTDDQKKVFDFFNEGTPQELAAIQGCSKKKVESILELRPYLSWQDLVKKCQMSRQLNTEMLNNTTDLLKMRDGISRLAPQEKKLSNGTMSYNNAWCVFQVNGKVSKDHSQDGVASGGTDK